MSPPPCSSFISVLFWQSHQATDTGSSWICLLDFPNSSCPLDPCQCGHLEANSAPWWHGRKNRESLEPRCRSGQPQVSRPARPRQRPCLQLRDENPDEESPRTWRKVAGRVPTPFVSVRLTHWNSPQQNRAKDPLHEGVEPCSLLSSVLVREMPQHILNRRAQGNFLAGYVRSGGFRDAICE